MESQQRQREHITEKFLDLADMTNPEEIFSGILSIIAEASDARACYVMTVCGNRHALELCCVYDPEKILQFKQKNLNREDGMEAAVAADGKPAFFRCTAHQKLYYCSTMSLTVSSFPVFYGHSPMATVSILRKDRVDGEPAQRLLKHCGKILKMGLNLREAQKTDQERRLFKSLMKLNSENEDFMSLLSRELYKFLGVRRCSIDLSEIYPPSDFCGKPSAEKCTAVKNQINVMCDRHHKSCGYNRGNYTTYCTPLNLKNGSSGVLSLEFPPEIQTVMCSEEEPLLTVRDHISSLINEYNDSIHYKKLLEAISNLYELNSELAKQSAPGGYMREEEVLSKVTAIISRLFHADTGKLWMPVQGKLLVGAQVPAGESLDMDIRDCGEGVLGWTMTKQKHYICHDTAKDPFFGEEEKNRCVLTAPLVLNGASIGAIQLFYAKLPHRFSPEELLSLEMLTSKAALVIDHARLMESNHKHTYELEEKSKALFSVNQKLKTINKRLTAAYEITRTLVNTLDIKKVLGMTLHHIDHIITNKPCAILIGLTDDSRRSVDMVSLERIPERTLRRRLINLEPDGFRPDFDGLAREKKMVSANHELIAYIKGKLGYAGAIRQIYLCPLPLTSGGAAGFLALCFEREDGLVEGEEQLFTAVSYQIAIAVKNGKLHEKSVLGTNQLLAVLNSMGDGVITVNGKGQISSFNRAALQLSGFTETQILQADCREIFGCDPQARSQCCIKHPETAKLCTEARAHNFSRTDNAGKKRFFESTISMIHSDERIEGEVIVFRDVTDKMEFEEMKADFIASIAHDLRTPLTSIKNYTATLAKHGKKIREQDKEEMYAVINSEVDRFGRLLANLTNLGHTALGNLVPRAENIDLYGIIVKAASLHRLTTVKHRIVLTAETNPIFAYADSDHVEQVVNNLLSNAIKYSPDGGDVDIRIFREKDRVKVSFRDEGVGIADSEVENLFKRYSRIGAGGAKSVTGTGLGLFICKNLIEVNGGSIAYEKPDRQGSLFYFTLPQRKETKA